MRTLFLVLIIFVNIGCDVNSQKSDLYFLKNELIKIQKNSKHLNYCRYNTDCMHMLRLVKGYYYENKDEYDRILENYRIMSEKAKISAMVHQLCEVERIWGLDITEIESEKFDDYLHRSFIFISEETINYYP